MEMLIWNIILSFVSGLVLWILKVSYDEMKRIQILLNRTREEVAKEYMTRIDVHHDFARVIDRIEKLDNKIDVLIKGQRNA